MEQNADGHNNKIVGGNTILGDAHFYISESESTKNIQNQSPKSLLTTESRQIEEESSNSDGIKEEQSVTALLESSQITKAGIDDDDDDDVSVPLNPREKYEDSRDKLLSIEQKVILLEERMEQLENTQKTLRQLITNNCTCIGALLYSWALMKQFILKHITFFFVTLFLAIVISFIVGLHYVANMSRP